MNTHDIEHRLNRIEELLQRIEPALESLRIDYLSPKDFAKATSLSLSTIRRAIAAGTLAHTRQGYRVLIHRSARIG